MYRQGLGDCLLLTFTNTRSQKQHMLIDCGVISRTTGGAARLDRVAQDILSATNRHIHTVVATHEHVDHISGFGSAAEIFGLHPDPAKAPDTPVQVDQVWMPWTEDPDDAGVQKLRQKNKTLSLALSAAMLQLEAGQNQALQNLLLFDVYDGGQSQAASQMDVRAAFAEDSGLALASTSKPKPPPGCRDLSCIMERLREWAAVDYLEPDDVREFPDYGIRIYVLGPSRRMRMLGGELSAKSVGMGVEISPLTAFMAAALKSRGFELAAEAQNEWPAADIDELYRLSFPFDPSQGIPLDEVHAPAGLESEAEDTARLEYIQANQPYLEFFQKVYGIDQTEQLQQPASSPEWYGATWRRIDQSWLAVSEGLALQKVSNVNNTSLVLAIELVESGKVLLFVGDAEEDNWATWENQHADLSALLANTVVYKVGHHGSHNATHIARLREMTHNDLVALAPVDVVTARGMTPNPWKFPADDLVKLTSIRSKPVNGNLYRLPLNTPATMKSEKKMGALFKQAKRRVIISCAGECPECEPLYDKQIDWPGKITVDPSSEKLWVDYTLKG
jgi:beta-lactamase superfamily II metal-dependent hydrolase